MELGRSQWVAGQVVVARRNQRPLRHTVLPGTNRDARSKPDSHASPDAQKDASVVLEDVMREGLVAPVAEAKSLAVRCAAQVDHEAADDEL